MDPSFVIKKIVSFKDARELKKKKKTKFFFLNDFARECFLDLNVLEKNGRSDLC